MIFIFGIPRSGTTVLYKLLCRHKDLAYFCTAWKKGYPRFILRKRHLVPLEGWVWHRCPETQYVDANADGKKELQNTINDCKRWWKRTDFIGKNPALSFRLNWINSIYPDAQYVLIERDTQANLESLSYHMNCSMDDAKIFRDRFQAAIRQDSHIPKNLIKISYEDFVLDPESYCIHILKSAGLSCDLEFPKTLTNMNYRHRT